MKTEIQSFNFDTHAVRTINQGEQPWFVALDVCRILDIANSRDAVADLDDDEKGVADLATLKDSTNGVTIKDQLLGNPYIRDSNVAVSLPNRGLQIVSESGLYALIFKSRKPEARAFRKWVTSEVLPAIRQTGSYKLKEERYIKLMGEHTSRGIKPLAAARLAYKICFREPVQPVAPTRELGFTGSLGLRFTGTAAEILQEARRRGVAGIQSESVTSLSKVLRDLAKRGDSRVEILPKSVRSHRALCFLVRL
jgi:prophage antirepressor-like protein